MSNDKNDALELAYNLSVAAVDGTLCASMGHDAATILRYQAAEIERLTKERDLVLTAAKYAEHIDATPENQRETMLHDTLTERDQLKAKNEKLVGALEELMGWQVKNVTAWSNAAYDYASKVLKEHT